MNTIRSRTAGRQIIIHSRVQIFSRSTDGRISVRFGTQYVLQSLSYTLRENVKTKQFVNLAEYRW
jgi:hypothetical protein